MQLLTGKKTKQEGFSVLMGVMANGGEGCMITLAAPRRTV